MERLKEIGRKKSWLAEKSGCPRSMISELLSGKRSGSTYLPEIHKALGWSHPLGPLLTRDDEELLQIAHSLTPEQRAALRERGLMLQEEKRRR